MESALQLDKLFAGLLDFIFRSLALWLTDQKDLVATSIANLIIYFYLDMFGDAIVVALFNTAQSMYFYTKLTMECDFVGTWNFHTFGYVRKRLQGFFFVFLCVC